VEHSFALVRAEFLQRLAEDNFFDLRIDDRPSSILEFIECLSVGNVAMRHFGLVEKAQFPDLTNLEMSFSEFLDQPIKFNNREIRLVTFFHENFCEPIAAALAREVSRSPHAPESVAALVEFGVSTWSEWATAMAMPERVHQLAGELANAAAKALANRSLISFFIKAPIPGKFSMWGPGASSGAGRKLPTRVIEREGYSVSVSVSRYEEVECAVTAYEWQGTLTLPGAIEPDAAACGMVYVFDREDGMLAGGLSDLIMASDSMTDEDVMQAKAFITQNDDAADVIEQSDLCFVWLWERRGGTEGGIGAKCLAVALEDLRRRFKKIRTVVFNAHPGQFVARRGIEPPMVTLERHTAVESLVDYIRGMGLKFDVRTIFSKKDNPQHDSLIAIGEAMGGRYPDPADDEDDDDETSGVGQSSINLNEWRDEVIELFLLAGLDDLADSLEGFCESYEEIEAALKYLIFDQSVQYLPVSSSGSFETLLLGLDEIPHQEAHETVPGIDEFCEHLPDNIRVISVNRIFDYVVCTVSADTPFGEFVEHFTLVRKPRPINVDSFLRRLQ